MEGFNESMEQNENVVEFPFGGKTGISFKTEQDPDDLISALLNEFEFDFDENPQTIDEVEMPKISTNEASFLLDEELELNECLSACEDLLSRLESKMKRISFYVGELEKTI